MRIAVVTESFFPQVNGVTNTVRHIVDRLLERGHEVLLVARTVAVWELRAGWRA